jgi:hypothetical protein
LDELSLDSDRGGCTRRIEGHQRGREWLGRQRIRISRERWAVRVEYTHEANYCKSDEDHAVHGAHAALSANRVPGDHRPAVRERMDVLNACAYGDSLLRSDDSSRRRLASTAG